MATTGPAADRPSSGGPSLAILRLARLAGLALWLGGFTFYSGAVIPILHDELDSLRTGTITQQATDRLNLIGGTTLAVWWASRLHRGLRGWGLRRLAASTALLIVLVALHEVMDRRLDEGRLRGFYPWHRAYLIVSTAQWAVNLGLLAGLAGSDGRRREGQGAGLSQSSSNET